MVKDYRFWTKDGVAVILTPETETQKARVIDMGRMWIVNRLYTCGLDYLIDFAEQHDIQIALQFVV